LQESNENENTIYHNLWGTAKAVLKGKAYSYEYLHYSPESSHIKSLMLHLKLLEKQELNSKPAEGDREQKGMKLTT
jgi:hypothetical protein